MRIGRDNVLWLAIVAFHLAAAGVAAELLFISYVVRDSFGLEVVECEVCLDGAVFQRDVASAARDGFKAESRIALARAGMNDPDASDLSLVEFGAVDGSF